jgi:Icc-related predicted phosphoesterase
MRLFYAADMHGSERVWRKFVNAAAFYHVDVLLLGGDLTGKVLVPVVESKPGRYVAQLFGGLERAKGEKALERLEEMIRFNGFYPYRCDQAEYARLAADPDYQAQVMRDAMVSEVRRWMQIADQKLSATKVRIYAIPGNDDIFEIDSALCGATVENVEGRVVAVGGYSLVSCAWGNPSPWNTPREEEEDRLLERLSRLADEVPAGSPTIFNLHIPPFDSGLDTGPEVAGIDEDGAVIVRTSGGVPQQAPVGSKAVRRVIEAHQPLISLHSHIHESRNVTHIGVTLCINPGSNYQDGRLEGALVELDEGSVVSYQLVSG